MLEILGAVERPTKLDQEALASLPGQVPDIAGRLPGRQGNGVLLTSVLDFAGVTEEARTLELVSADGSFHAEVELSEAQEAILVFGLGGGELPDSEGGPVRFFLHDAEACRGHGDAPCANVKNLGRIEVRR